MFQTAVICLIALVLSAAQLFAGEPGDDEGGYSLETAAEYTRQQESQNRHNHHGHHEHHEHHENQGHGDPHAFHETGKVRFSLKIMQMHMRGSKIGQDNVTNAQILATANQNGGMFSQLRMVPEEMDSMMIMAGAMTKLSNHTHLMIMVPYIEKEMRIRSYNANGTAIGAFQTTSEGLGDIKVKIARPIRETNHGNWTAMAELSLPTGSTDEQGVVLTPMGQYALKRLPYGMQLGSGTFDIKPSLQGRFTAGDWRIETSFSALIRLGRGDDGYAYGDEIQAGLSIGRPVGEFLASLDLDMRSAASIDGKDPLINAPVQTAQTRFYGGQRATLTARLSLKDRLSVFVTAPVYEDLHGPQMSLDHSMGVQAQFSF